MKTFLRRTAWNDFPDVIIHAEESVVKKHYLYEAAKAGDKGAAFVLTFETTSKEAIDKMRERFAEVRPHLLPVHALESTGVNAIPQVLANFLSRWLKLPVAAGIIQINRVTHTAASGYHRLAFPALFDGIVKEQEYFLVDDFIGQGGTLANLKGYIESQGARVVGATALTGKAYSAKLTLSAETLKALREKHGKELEIWWYDAFGFGFERLTESEARYLIRSDNAYAITERIVAARTS
ncbi:MAG: phosphoribosyltransferase [Acidobacteria bacterium]|nr:phosphoribosyltransferase [Acidobacteriota bacterium]